MFRVELNSTFEHDTTDDHDIGHSYEPYGFKV